MHYGSQIRQQMKVRDQKETEERMIVKDVPSTKLDLKLSFGEDGDLEQLLSIDANIFFQRERVEEVAEEATLGESLGQDFYIRFNFLTESSRMKEAEEYFENGFDTSFGKEYDQNLSYLQNMLKRPNKSGKVHISKSFQPDGKGFVSLVYQYYNQVYNDQAKNLLEIIKKLSETPFQPDLQLNINIRGKYQALKKNRSIIKNQFSTVRVHSDSFPISHISGLIKCFSDEPEEVNPVIDHPMFKLLENLQQMELDLKFSSVRKMLKLFHIGTSGNVIPQRLKEYPDVVHGLFQDKMEILLGNASSVAAKIEIKFKDEQVLMRMLKSFYNLAKALQ